MVAKDGEYFLFEPRVLSEPAVVLPGWVRQREKRWQVAVIGANRFRQGSFRLATEVVLLGIRPNQKGCFHFGQVRPKACMPGRSTLGPGRRIAAALGAWIAEAHGKEANVRTVVEGLAFDTQPQPQAVAGWVVPGDARGVNASTRRLANQQHACLLRKTKDGAWPQRQRVRAQFAPADFRDQRF